MSEDRVSLRLLDEFPTPIWRAGPDTKCDFFNKSWLVFTGRTMEQECGDGWAQGVHPEDLNRCVSTYLAAFHAREPFEMEYRLRRHDGEYRWIVDFGRPFNDAEGQFAGYIGSCYDITERKQTEAALRTTEERFRAFMDNLPAVAFLKDVRGRYVYVNHTWERIYRRSRSEWYGKVDTELWPAEVARRLVESDRRAMAENRPVEQVHTIPTPTGEQREWLAFKFPIADASGGLGVGGVAIDVTERRQLEEQLRQSQKLEAIGRLAGGVAHDFNNLLMIVLGTSQRLLHNYSHDHQLRGALEQIKYAGDRAAELTRQLLAFSRKQVIVPKVLDINAIVAGMSPMLRRLLGEDIDLFTSLHPALGPVKMDAGQLEQVLMNLAANARDAMPQGGKLTIETDNVEIKGRHRHDQMVMPGRYAALVVSDTGNGIGAETQPHIFEPFFTTKPQGKGTGLGLSTVYGIVKQSGGYIFVYSEVGQGTAFKVYLPRVDDAIESVRSEQDAAVLPQGTETILVVEDEPGVRSLVCAALEQLGYRVLEASLGSQALLMAERHAGPIHLLLTDVVMPQMNGPEVAARLLARRPGVKVLFMSGYADNAIVHHSIIDPGAAFLQKPFDTDVLAYKVRAVLSGLAG